MARALTTAYKNAATSGSIAPAYLVELEFDSGALRLFTGYGELSWDSKTWYGGGDLLNVDLPGETKDMEARGATLQLSGAPDSVVATALTEEYSGRPARVWLALFDASGSIIADPTRIFTGKIDRMPILDDPDNPVISLTAENDLVALTKAKERRYTHEDQQIDYPGDMFFEFVTQMQDKEIEWG